MTPSLRPLTIGELFDRVVTLTLREWRLFAIIGLIFDFVPAVVFFRQHVGDYGLFSGRSATASRFDLLADIGLTSALGIVQLGVLLIAYDRLQHGRPAKLGAVLVGGLARVPAIVVLSVVEGVALVAIALAAVLAFASLRGALGSLALTIAVAAVPILLLVAVAIVVFVLFTYAIVASVIDGTSPFAATRATVRRMRSPGRLGPAIVVAFAPGVFAFAAGVGSALAGSGLILIDRSGTIANTLRLVVTIAATTLAYGAFAAFDLDLRVRTEGLDLELAAGSVRADASSR